MARVALVGSWGTGQRLAATLPTMAWRRLPGCHGGGRYAPAGAAKMAKATGIAAAEAAVGLEAAAVRREVARLPADLAAAVRAVAADLRTEVVRALTDSDGVITDPSTSRP